MSLSDLAALWVVVAQARSPMLSALHITMRRSMPWLIAAMAVEVPRLPTARSLARIFRRLLPPPEEDTISVTLSPSCFRYPFLKATAQGRVEVIFAYSEIASVSACAGP